eukprot:GEMP01032067.1.p1 GENE.GEMP01032067.1~~GEMP01032067.1.p1  ORF type:complete len:108 (+),score=28.01 GEMP01032067.1:1100-1423(+)
MVVKPTHYSGRTLVLEDNINDFSYSALNMVLQATVGDRVETSESDDEYEREGMAPRRARFQNLYTYVDPRHQPRRLHTRAVGRKLNFNENVLRQPPRVDRAASCAGK